MTLCKTVGVFICLSYLGGGDRIGCNGGGEKEQVNGKKRKNCVVHTVTL